MPAPIVTRLAPQTPPSHPFLIPIPGASRTISRRSAQNRSAALSAYAVPDSKTKILNSLSVSVKRANRLMAITLKGDDGGHEQQIVDLEFLPSTPHQPVFVLGSCDTDGVVFLWFLYIPKDALGHDIELRLLKKYSFYSLRRSTSAYYTRIRLAGTPDDGTMVLVRNDGSNCRIVNFSCHVDQPEHPSKAPAIAPAEPVPQLPAPDQPPPQQPTPVAPEPPTVEAETPLTTSDNPLKAESRNVNPAVATGLAAGAAVGAGAGAVAGATFGALAHDSDERVIGEGLLGDHDSAAIGETIDPAATGETFDSAIIGETFDSAAIEETFDSAAVEETLDTVEPGTLVEDADEDEEYVDAVEHVIPPAEQHEQVYAEGLRDTSDSVQVETIEETRGINSYMDDHEEVIAEEVIEEEAVFDGDEEIEEYEEHEEEVLEELEENEEEEYEEYVEPEVERVYGEGLGNGHEANHAPRY